METPYLRIDPNHLIRPEASSLRIAEMSGELSTYIRRITTRPADLNSFISKNGELNTTETYIDPQNANRRYRLPAYQIGKDQNRDRVKLGLTNNSDNEAVLFFADPRASRTDRIIYKLDNGKVSKHYKRPGGDISYLAIAPNKELYFSNASDFQLCKLENGTERLIYRHNTYLRDVQFDSRGRLYFSEATGAGGDGFIYRLDGSTATVFYRVRLSQVGFWAGNFAFDNNNNLWLSSGNRIPANLYKVSGGVAQEVFTSPDECIEGFSFEQSGKLIYANGKNKIYCLTVPGFQRSEIYVFPSGQDLCDVALATSSSNEAIARLKVYLASSFESSNGKATGQHTMEPGTGFIFSSQKVTSGTGVDRDIWWNRLELIPKDRMYSLGRISNVEDIVQIATGEFKFDAFVPSLGEGFAVEIKRDSQVEYAILQIISVADNLTFEWLYPFKKQVTGHSERNSRSISTKVTRITFDRFPDGTPITPDQFLTGDEFLSKGIRLAGAPESSYCSEATATAIRRAGTYGGVTFPFLTTASPGAINRCNSIPIAITFTQPTRHVTLTFAGASVTYVIKAYDSSGRLLGTAQQDAVFRGGTFDITFNSETTNISKVTFGYQAAITAIKEIRYESPESTLYPLPHDVALGLKYMIPEKVEGTGRGGTWKNIGFDEVKQTGEKAIEATLNIRSKPELDGIYRAMSESQYDCQIAVHCEADLCYQPSPDFIDENGQPAYVKVRASYNQILPFHFPTDTHGYIYPPGYTPTVEVALVRHQISPDQAIYEDTTQPALFYYLPEEFRLTRDDVAPYHPSLQVAFHTVSAQAGNTSDPHQVEFTFKVVPYLKQERIKAALHYIDRNDLVPTDKIPSLAPLNPDSACFFLTLPKEEGGFEVVERKQAHVVFNRQIIDTLILSSKAFAEVFHSMRVGGETLNGHVKVRLPGRDDEQEIPFSGRLDKMVGPITEQFLVNQSSADRTTYKLNVINAIESPITLREAIFYLRFDPEQNRWVPAIADPGTLPLSLRAGEEKEITLNSTQPISHAWSVKLEPIKTKVELDFEALWLSVQETPGWQDLTHDVTVQVDERYFSGPDALNKVIITFNDEEAIVTLTRDAHQATVKLIKPFLLYLLRDEEANDYVYNVASYRNQQLIATKDFPKDDTPLLNIVPPLEE